MNSFLSIVNAKYNKKYIINIVEDDCSPVMRRLGDMGFIEGEEIVLLKKSMLKKSVLITLGGIKMMLRYDLAEKIIVKDI